MNLHEALAGAMRDAAGARRFVEEFAAHHSGPITPGDGYDEAEVSATEDRLGFALPAALREAYIHYGRRDDLVACQDYLLAPGELKPDRTGTVLVFRSENQSVTHWGVPLARIGEPDPPVVYHDDTVGWRPWMDRLSSACMEMVLSEWILGGDRDAPGRADNRTLTEEAVAVLEARAQRLPLPGYPQWAAPDDPPVRWFTMPGTVLRDDGTTWLWARTETKKQLRQLRRLLPGDWLLS
ncbi:hypothetical protein [Actinoplanes italicus]|nr:hypothetical protein [Actinoplanes italicus]